MTPKPDDLCGHDNCQKPYSAHHSRNLPPRYCFDALEVPANSDEMYQTFTPAPEPTKEEPKPIALAIDAMTRAQHQEPQTPEPIERLRNKLTPFFTVVGIAKIDPSQSHDIGKWSEAADIEEINKWLDAASEELSQLREEVKQKTDRAIILRAQGDALAQKADYLESQNKELKEENERLKAGEQSFLLLLQTVTEEWTANAEVSPELYELIMTTLKAGLRDKTH